MRQICPNTSLHGPGCIQGTPPSSILSLFAFFLKLVTIKGPLPRLHGAWRQFPDAKPTSCLAEDKISLGAMGHVAKSRIVEVWIKFLNSPHSLPLCGMSTVSCPIATALMSAKKPEVSQVSAGKSEHSVSSQVPQPLLLVVTLTFKPAGKADH